MTINWIQAHVLARQLLNYHKLNQVLEHAEIIIGLGTNDPRVAERAADLFHEGRAQLVVFTGGVSSWTRGLYNVSEAEKFAEIAQSRGVPEENILIEPRASNTGENVSFTRALLAERGVNITTAIAVQ